MATVKPLVVGANPAAVKQFTTGDTLSIDGDITLAGVARRFRADTINATLTNRFFFQDSGANTETAMFAIPSGTATSAYQGVFNNSNPTNAAYVWFAIGATGAALECGKTGTGTYVQLAITVGGTNRVTINPTTGLCTFANDVTITGTTLIDTTLEAGYKNIPRVTGGIVKGKVNVITAGLTLNTGPAAESTYSIYNDSAAAVTITQGSGLTLRVAGTATTGNYSLAQRGWITVWYNSTTEAIIL